MVMFNVCRNKTIPVGLLSKNYRHSSVVSELIKIFHGKCYLCENNDLQSPRVEHLIPHQNSDILKYDWGNLFYSCDRCNNIKSDIHKDILDCTDRSLDIDYEIMHILPSILSEEITLKTTSISPSKNTLETMTLLNDCFNLQNTPFRRQTRMSLLEKMEEINLNLKLLRMDLKKLDTPENIKADCLSRIKLMCNDNYPFSIFWKWFVYKDEYLQNIYPPYKEFAESIFKKTP